VIKHSLAWLLLAASLAACARENTPAPAAAPNAASSGSTAPSAMTPGTAGATASSAAASSGGKGPSDIAAAAATQQEGADLTASKDKDDSGQTQLERIAALPAEGQLPGGKWVAGTNYKVVLPAQPTDVPPGKVEVMEFFWYGCPHCYALEPAVESWDKSKANYIDFVRVPAMWGEVQRAHARLFYTLKSLGKAEELQTRVFETIHMDHVPLYAPNDPLETQREQQRFAKSNGIDEGDFMKAYNAFATQNGMSRADDLNRRYRIDAVPTFVIAGKYETDMQSAGGESNLFQIINDLAASEKHH
jgi:thiol:disulfide interchange protein DsbA